MSTSQLVRLAEAGRIPLSVYVDGRSVDAQEGDTVLTAMLLSGRRLRDNEFDSGPRAGFCLMGACQECWVWLEDGTRVRACSTPAVQGMSLLTHSPLKQWAIQES